jgi:hypothetical protein
MLRMRNNFGAETGCKLPETPEFAAILASKGRSGHSATQLIGRLGRTRLTFAPRRRHADPVANVPPFGRPCHAHSTKVQNIARPDGILDSGMCFGSSEVNLVKKYSS